MQDHNSKYCKQFTQFLSFTVTCKRDKYFIPGVPFIRCALIKYKQNKWVITTCLLLQYAPTHLFGM